MIRKATITDDTYVPYGLLRFKASGKNLLDVNSVVGGVFEINSPELPSSGKWLTTKFIEVIEKVVTVSVNNESDNCVVRFNEYDSEKNFLRQQGNICGVNGNTSKTITLQDNTKYVRLSFGFNNRACTAESYVASGNTIQLEYGSVATDYEPYQENSVILSQPIKLNGIGDIKDRIVEKDGVYGVERKFAEVVFDGSEDWNYAATNDSEKYRNEHKGIMGVIKPVAANSVKGNALCTHYNVIESNSIGTYGCNMGLSVNTSGGVYVYDSTFNTSDVSLWKAHLAENPITVLYELAEPTFEPLPEVDQIALRNFHTHKPTTIITNDVNAYMEVEYVADTKIHIAQNYVPVSVFKETLDRISALERLHV